MGTDAVPGGRLGSMEQQHDNDDGDRDDDPEGHNDRSDQLVAHFENCAPPGWLELYGPASGTTLAFGVIPPRSHGAPFSSSTVACSSVFAACRRVSFCGLNTQHDPGWASGLAWRAAGDDNALFNTLHPVNLTFEPLRLDRHGRVHTN
jgi:hypothetical protein